MFGKSILDDIVSAGTQIAASGTDWTIIRLPVLGNNPGSAKLNIGYTRNGKIDFFSLSRADLADFLLKQLTEDTYLRKKPRDQQVKFAFALTGYLLTFIIDLTNLW